MAAHVKHNAYKVPESVVVPGTAKRNILRKGAPIKERKAGAATNLCDDGTTYRDAAALDQADPNYDSEEETDREYQRNTRSPRSLTVATAKMTLSQFKTRVDPVIKEFFVSGDVLEVLRGVGELGCPSYGFEFVKRAVNMSLDAHDRYSFYVYFTSNCNAITIGSGNWSRRCFLLLTRTSSAAAA